MNTPSTTFSAGLEGVIACATRLSHVDGSAGRLIFSGHNAVKLAESKTVEEVWFLLHEGRLPTAEELAAFRAKVETLGKLSRAEINLVKKARGTEPLSAFRTAISAIACHRGFKPWLNREVAEVEQEVLQLQALAPSIVEIIHTGKAPVRKRQNKGYAERYLWGVTGKRPSTENLRAVETYLILTIDHGLNASTFSGRVTASTGADVGAAITAAVGTLSGPLHGGAPGPVLDMLDSIGAPEKAASWVQAD
ncbi:MAG: citrate/2-methylcitrate synthase, partial [Candidatus Obscuribacterales bacterium]|nr:citrate/2-methylcitrate synthase [Candidatus Obscuribacterales bacterium]